VNSRKRLATVDNTKAKEFNTVPIKLHFIANGSNPVMEKEKVVVFIAEYCLTDFFVYSITNAKALSNILLKQRSILSYFFISITKEMR
jgi:hypothetical protein